MTLRLLCLLTFTVLVAFAAVTTAGAVSQPTPSPSAALPQALFPDDIFHPVDLDTFSYHLKREVTGSTAERLYDVYLDWEQSFPGILPQRSNNAPFTVEWVGDYENPGRFQQALRLSNGPNIYTEWFVGDEGRSRYKDGALTFVNDRDIEALYWWDSILTWLDNHGDAVTCGTASQLINGEQAVRCTAPNLSREARVELIDASGLHGEGYSETVSRATLELWLTRNDSIPVRLTIAAAGIDEYGDRFSGTFRLDFLDLDSEDIYVDLPRS